MLYPNEEIENNINTIHDLIIDEKEIDELQRSYLKDVKYFMSIYEDLVLKEELSNLDLDLDQVIHYLNSLEEKLQRTYKACKEEDKKEKYSNMLKRIEFLKVKGIYYIKDYIIDNYPREENNLNSFLNWFEKNDSYFKGLSTTGKSNLKSVPFYERNKYAETVKFNDKLILLTKKILSGDIKLYNTIEKIVRLSRKNPERESEIRSELPEWLNDVKIDDLERIIYYDSGRKTDNHFSHARVTIEFMEAYSQALNGNYIPTNKLKIEKRIMHTLDDYILGNIRDEELTNYEVLNYFDKSTDDQKFRKMLKDNDYDLNKIVDLIKNDELIKSTYNNKKGSLLFERDSINPKNTYLLAEYVNGNTSLLRDLRVFYETGSQRVLSKIPEEVVGAEIAVVEKASEVQPFSSATSHKYDKDKYDMRILQAISLFQDKPRRMTIEGETIEAHKTIL